MISSYLTLQGTKNATFFVFLQYVTWTVHEPAVTLCLHSICCGYFKDFQSNSIVISVGLHCGFN